MKHDDSEYLGVKCTLQGDKEFVIDIVQYIAERLKFKDDIYKVRADGNDEITAIMEIKGFFCNKHGKIKKAKGFRAQCVPNISWLD